MVRHRLAVTSTIDTNQEETLCTCGCSIISRHMARHLSSKRHREQLDWKRTVLLVALAEYNIRERPQESTTE